MANEYSSFNNNICNILGCHRDTISFNYMGIPLFSSAKMQFFQPLANIVKSKLASWGGMCLSIMECVQFVNFVISSIMFYNF